LDCLDCGADLVQLNSGLVFAGPFLEQSSAFLNSFMAGYLRNASGSFETAFRNLVASLVSIGFGTFVGSEIELNCCPPHRPLPEMT